MWKLTRTVFFFYWNLKFFKRQFLTYLIFNRRIYQSVWLILLKIIQDHLNFSEWDSNLVLSDGNSQFILTFILITNLSYLLLTQLIFQFIHFFNLWNVQLLWEVYHWDNFYLTKWNIWILRSITFLLQKRILTLFILLVNAEKKNFFLSCN